MESVESLNRLYDMMVYGVVGFAVILFVIAIVGGIRQARKDAETVRYRPSTY